MILKVLSPILLMMCSMHILVFSQTADRASGQQISLPNDTLFLSLENWDSYGSIELWTIPWRYRPGDEDAWALPETEDSSWQRIYPNLRERQFPAEAWKGIGWFRLHLFFAEPLDHVTFGLRGGHAGTVRIYWDGNLLAGGIDYRTPTSIPSNERGHHILAVRLEIDDIGPLHAIGSSGGFFFWLVDFYGSIRMLMQQRSEQMFFTAFLLAFAILHLTLYLYNPATKSNLYYTIFLLLSAATVYVDIEQAYLSTRSDQAYSLLVAHRALVPFGSILFLRFLYSVFYSTVPRQFWIITGIMLIVGVFIVTAPSELYDLYVYASTIVTMEMVRVVLLAVRRKKPGAWTFAVGLLLVGVFSAYDTVLDLGVMEPIAHVTNAYYFGFFGMMIAMSIHLAKDYARTSSKLVEQLKRTQEEELARRLVEVDNRRKTQELEDARQLQLSMLPACANDISGLDICFHMKTATEVGGDYYDYLERDDGSVVIAVGDATGHGMRAGTMVSIIKGLFVTRGSQDGPAAFLTSGSNAIRNMRLGNLYMGLTLARLEKNTLTIASAGMPPSLIYRKHSGTIEELVIKSMPMGGPSNQAYEERTSTLEPGDSLLLMSDGLAELFNEDREMFDTARIKELFLQLRDGSAADIVSSLQDRADTWRGTSDQADDITLVVLKKL